NTVGITGMAILFTGALFQAKADMETPDGWFRGFPAEWNVIVPSLFLLHLNPWINIAVCWVLVLASLSHLQFPHPVQVRERRLVSLAFMGVWLGSMTVLAIQQDRGHMAHGALRALLVLAPMWTVFQVVERAWSQHGTGWRARDGDGDDVGRAGGS